jgi:hypothetical protein
MERMMTDKYQAAPPQRRRSRWPLVAALLLAAALLGVVWQLPRMLRPASSPGAVSPTATLVPTYTATPTPQPTATATPTPTLLHLTLTGVDATVDDAAGTITFRVQAQVPPDRQVAEALLWYDTEAGHRLQRTAGPLSSTASLSYTLAAAQEGLTRTLTTTQEIDYWWLVRDTAGETARSGGTARLGPNLQALVTLPAPEAPVSFTWSVSDTQHYQFYYAPGSAAERDRSLVGAMAEGAFVRVRDALGADFAGKMKAYLVPRVFWQGGAAYGEKVQLISYLDRNYTGVETWSYFTHEGTHALAQDLIQPKEEGGPDGVLVEGLAVWASEGHYAEEPIDDWAAVVAASEGYLPLATLRAGPFYDFQHEISYLEAGSFVKYLADRYGLEKLKQLYGQATGKAEHDEELVQQLYGRGYAELDAGWLDYLKGLAPTAEQAETWRLQVRSFDLMRRYETELDPDARILPDKTPPEWTSDTLKVFLHPREAPANVVLETTLIAVQDRIRAGDREGAASLLDDVQAALDAGGRAIRPSLEARQAIVDLVARQDRAVLRADALAYWGTLDPGAVSPATLTQTLQLPMTEYRQELVRLDVTGDGQAAQGIVVVHAQVADGVFAEDGRLFAVAFVLKDGLWRMAHREPAQPVLGLP